MTESLAIATTRQRSHGRTWIAAVISVGILAFAVAAGLLSSPGSTGPAHFIDELSSRIGQVASHAGAWWTYAFLLGAVAAFNPCGFSLVPAYVGLYLSDAEARAGVGSRVRRALAISLVVAGTFVSLFGVTGVLVSAGSSLISATVVRSFPWVGLGAGFALILIGGVLLSGRSLRLTPAQGIARTLGRTASGSGTRAYAAFGLGYGLASLGCTLPLFVALIGTATAAGGSGYAVVAVVLYGMGMATVLGALTLVTAALGTRTVTRLQGAGRFIPVLSAMLFLASGAYVIYYWLSVGRALFA